MPSNVISIVCGSLGLRASSPPSSGQLLRKRRGRAIVAGRRGMTARILPQRALTTDCFPRQNQAQGSARERKAPELHRMRRVFHKRALLFALWQARGEAQMARYKIGDRVTWNSEAGRVSGTITKIHERGFQYKGHNRHASKE